MFRHNLLLIYRSFKRFKSIFLINIVGLTSGLVCTLLIYLWVTDELNIDQFFADKDRLYYAWEHRVKADGIWTSPNTPAPLADEMVKDFQEVELACIGTRNLNTVLSIGEKIIKINGRYAGKDFFRVFSYPLLEGNATSILAAKNSMAISESLALKFFNTTQNVVGKTITRDLTDDFIISGIFKDMPAAGSEQFEFVIPFEEFLSRNDWAKDWGNTGTATYVLLREGVDIDSFNSKIAKYLNLKTNNQSNHKTLFLKKYADIYLHGTYENGVLTGGRISYVKLFTIIAVFILVIACINFMNLSTAKATRRLKEIGIKKAVGASRGSLIAQYLGESLLISFLSLLLAVLIVDVSLSGFSTLTGKKLSIVFDKEFIISLSMIGITAGLLAGSYPALYLSGFKSVTVLKGKINNSLGEVWARKGLVAFQFALSVILIVSVIIVYKQLEFIQSKNLGYNKDNLLYFIREGNLTEEPKVESFLTEVKRIPGIVNASTSSHTMSGHQSGTSGIVWTGKDPDDRTEFENFAVNYGMMEMLGIELDSGRYFNNQTLADTSSLIINEAGLALMGIENPIGAHVTFWGRDMEIVGVSKNFHYESLHEQLKPALFRYAPQSANAIMIKVAPENVQETVAQLQRSYESFNPGFPFNYTFMDADYQSLYKAETRVAMLSRYFAGLAIIISCLGLFALASFTAERRIKEIGIRKVLGSTEAGIVLLLSSDFTKVVLASIIVALPISYFLTKTWLQGFAFKIDLELWHFVGAGLAALAIAWLTVGIQALRVARLNPTKCLKED